MVKRNAIIMAAGTSSRFIPLSAQVPKALLEVKGEVLIERQIRQLHEAGINDITLVVGYKAEMFDYLKEKFGIAIRLNEDYFRYNNTSSLIRVLDKLGNTYICSSDNYFPENVFKDEPAQSYYSALYSSGETEEYCISFDNSDNITAVGIGGHDSWYMVGHVYFTDDFSRIFKDILISEYETEETRHQYWEDVYIKYISQLPKMKIHRYAGDEIFEFDSIDELRRFDHSYIDDTRSSILKQIARELNCSESALSTFKKIDNDNNILMFSFIKDSIRLKYDGTIGKVSQL